MNKLFMGVIVTCAMILTLTIFMAVWYQGAVKGGQPHKCRWSQCPYKFVAYSARTNAVTYYVGDSLAYSDAWCIDVLHIENPELEYDQLDSLLFQFNKR